ncbi:MAG: hypothetical protein HQL20_01655, partial [Candidatus Omnitrophica bacterium]|nr:hypothetical protein [Candidatus Omnitrophota bacterium]
NGISKLVEMGWRDRYVNDWDPDDVEWRDNVWGYLGSPAGAARTSWSVAGSAGATASSSLADETSELVPSEAAPAVEPVAEPAPEPAPEPTPGSAPERVVVFSKAEISRQSIIKLELLRWLKGMTLKNLHKLVAFQPENELDPIAATTFKEYFYIGIASDDINNSVDKLLKENFPDVNHQVRLIRVLELTKLRIEGLIQLLNATARAKGIPQVERKSFEAMYDGKEVVAPWISSDVDILIEELGSQEPDQVQAFLDEQAKQLGVELPRKHTPPLDTKEVFKAKIATLRGDARVRDLYPVIMGHEYAKFRQLTESSFVSLCSEGKPNDWVQAIVEDLLEKLKPGENVFSNPEPVAEPKSVSAQEAAPDAPPALGAAESPGLNEKMLPQDKARDLPAEPAPDSGSEREQAKGVQNGGPDLEKGGWGILQLELKKILDDPDYESKVAAADRFWIRTLAEVETYHTVSLRQRKTVLGVLNHYASFANGKPPKYSALHHDRICSVFAKAFKAKKNLAEADRNLLVEINSHLQANARGHQGEEYLYEEDLTLIEPVLKRWEELQGFTVFIESALSDLAGPLGQSETENIAKAFWVNVQKLGNWTGKSGANNINIGPAQQIALLFRTVAPATQVSLAADIFSGMPEGINYADDLTEGIVTLLAFFLESNELWGLLDPLFRAVPDVKSLESLLATMMRPELRPRYAEVLAKLGKQQTDEYGWDPNNTYVARLNAVARPLAQAKTAIKADAFYVFFDQNRARLVSGTTKLKLVMKSGEVHIGIYQDFQFAKKPMVLSVLVGNMRMHLGLDKIDNIILLDAAMNDSLVDASAAREVDGGIDLNAIAPVNRGDASQGVEFNNEAVRNAVGSNFAGFGLTINSITPLASPALLFGLAK